MEPWIADLEGYGKVLSRSRSWPGGTSSTENVLFAIENFKRNQPDPDPINDDATTAAGDKHAVDDVEEALQALNISTPASESPEEAANRITEKMKNHYLNREWLSILVAMQELNTLDANPPPMLLVKMFRYALLSAISLEIWPHARKLLVVYTGLSKQVDEEFKKAVSLDAKRLDAIILHSEGKSEEAIERKAEALPVQDHIFGSILEEHRQVFEAIPIKEIQPKICRRDEFGPTDGVGVGGMTSQGSQAVDSGPATAATESIFSDDDDQLVTYGGYTDPADLELQYENSSESALGDTDREDLLSDDYEPLQNESTWTEPEDVVAEGTGLEHSEVGGGGSDAIILEGITTEGGCYDADPQDIESEAVHFGDATSDSSQTDDSEQGDGIPSEIVQQGESQSQLAQINSIQSGGGQTEDAKAEDFEPASTKTKDAQQGYIPPFELLPVAAYPDMIQPEEYTTQTGTPSSKHRYIDPSTVSGGITVRGSLRRLAKSFLLVLWLRGLVTFLEWYVPMVAPIVASELENVLGVLMTLLVVFSMIWPLTGADEVIELW